MEKDFVEKTLIIFKPDSIKRNLLGEIITRFEKTGLEIKEIKLVYPDREIMEKHYSDDINWITNLGEKTLDFFKETNQFEQYLASINEMFGTKDPVELGMAIRVLLIEFMLESPLIVSIWEGSFACSKARKIIGNTIPLNALPGTIRGDYSSDSPISLLTEGRCIYNLVHASGDAIEAEREINIWFPQMGIKD